MSYLAFAGLAFAQVGAAPRPIMPAATPASFADHQAQCAGKDGWSDAAPPIRIFGNVYDVGSCGIVVVLIAGPKGHIVIDAATTEAAPGVIANIQRLGFRLADVKVLLSSHEHFDHAAGLAQLQQQTGARMMAVAASKPSLESGIASASDPQASELPPFKGPRVDHVLKDGEIVAVGPLRLTAHATPGHAPGSTSWSWTSTDNGVSHSIVYADSVTAIALGKYRFSDHPDYVAVFKTSLGKIAHLPCDLLITPHPAVSNFYARLARAAPLSDPAACMNYAATGRRKLDERLAAEAAGRG